MQVNTPIQHNYEAGVEVRSLLSTEQLEEVDDRLAVTDVDPHSGARFVNNSGGPRCVCSETCPPQRREMLNSVICLARPLTDVSLQSCCSRAGACSK